MSAEIAILIGNCIFVLELTMEKALGLLEDIYSKISIV